MESNAQHGWFLRLTKKEETAVRKQLEGARYLILEHRKARLCVEGAIGRRPYSSARAISPAFPQSVVNPRHC